MLSHFSHVKLFATPCTITHQALLSMGFSGKNTGESLPDPGIEPVSLIFPALAGGFFTTSTTWEAQSYSAKEVQNHSHWQANSR